MNDEEMLSILQHYRHDLMNELQVIQGYLTMGKETIANDKINTMFGRFQEERKLIQLDIPKFALWLIRFNSIYDLCRLTYNIHIEDRGLSTKDERLLERCKQVIDRLPSDTFFNIHITLDEKQNNENEIVVEMNIEGDVESNELDMNSDLEVTESEKGVMFTFIV